MEVNQAASSMYEIGDCLWYTESLCITPDIEPS
jgi:hypothetical protein